MPKYEHEAEVREAASELYQNGETLITTDEMVRQFDIGGLDLSETHRQVGRYLSDASTEWVETIGTNDSGANQYEILEDPAGE